MAKKVLIIGEAFFPEDFIINDLAQEWHSNGYEVEVLTRTPSYPFGKTFKGFKNKFYQKTFFDKIPVHRILVIPGYQKNKLIKVLNYFSFVFFASIVALLIGKRFDRIFVYQTGPLTVALPGNLIKILFKKPLTIWTQDLWPDTVYAYGFKKSKALEFGLNSLVSFVYNNSDRIALSCRGFIPKLQPYLKGQKSTNWIPNWPIIESESTSKIKLPGEFNFTFAGNLGKVQNLRNVLAGFKSVSNKFPNAWFNLIGDGSAMEELKLFVDSENILNVNFEGRKPLELMPDYFQASDVLIISLIDAPIYEIMIPSKFQTYLSYQKPIFAIMKGEVPAMVSQFNIGGSSDPDNIVDIQNGFEKFINSSEKELRYMGSESKKLLNNYFLRERNIKSLTKITFE